MSHDDWQQRRAGCTSSHHLRSCFGLGLPTRGECASRASGTLHVHIVSGLLDSLDMRTASCLLCARSGWLLLRARGATLAVGVPRRFCCNTLDRLFRCTNRATKFCEGIRSCLPNPAASTVAATARASVLARCRPQHCPHKPGVRCRLRPPIQCF